MAKEYIDRERMIKCFCGHCMAEGTEDCIDCYDKKLIQNLPAADVRKNVKGEWIEDRMEIVCTKCHARYSDEIIFMNRNMEAEPLKYCPNCGAQMGGAEDG